MCFNGIMDCVCTVENGPKPNEPMEKYFKRCWYYRPNHFNSGMDAFGKILTPQRPTLKNRPPKPIPQQLLLHPPSRSHRQNRHLRPGQPHRNHPRPHASRPQPVLLQSSQKCFERQI